MWWLKLTLGDERGIAVRVDYIEWLEDVDGEASTRIHMRSGATIDVVETRESITQRMVRANE